MNIFHFLIFRAELFSRTTSLRVILYKISRIWTSLRKFARNFIRAKIYTNKVGSCNLATQLNQSLL